MINIRQAQKFCSEPIELIENYHEAVKDDKVWHCHHVWESMLGYSKQELIDMDEYFGIPACNLIFLKPSEHMRLHKKGKKLSEEHRKKLSESKKGEKNPNFGKHLSEEHYKKLIESIKGEKNYMFGKHHTEETKKKISESKKGKKLSEEQKSKMSKSHINNEKLSKPILQFTKDGEFVAEYPSISECMRNTHIHSSSISSMLKNKRKYAGGYIFKYKQI